MKKEHREHLGGRVSEEKRKLLARYAEAIKTYLIALNKLGVDPESLCKLAELQFKMLQEKTPRRDIEAFLESAAAAEEAAAKAKNKTTS